jgi:hypothetical protein
MNGIEEIQDLLNSDGFTACNKKLLRKIGIRATLIYSELLTRYIYFEKRKQLNVDGFFYNTIIDLQEAIGLSGKQQRSEIRKLKSIGLLEQVNMGIPSKRYFKISNNVALIKQLMVEEEKDVPWASTDGSEGSNISYQGLPKVHTNNNNYKTPINKNEINKKNVNGFLEKSSDRKFYLSFIKYYFGKYENCMQQEHPVLRVDKWKKVIDTIDEFLDEHEIEEIESLTKMVDAYFDQQIECDRNILHFATSGILENRYYEKLY